MTSPALELVGLHVTFDASTRAVRGVDLSVDPGEIHAVVGESGCGKTATCRAVTGLLPPNAAVKWDLLRITGTELRGAGDLRALRGRRVAMVFQEPSKHLNPALTIGAVLNEAVKRHLGLSGDEARKRCERLMEMVELDERVLSAFPHELSGGMKQRALIALAISCEPSLLIADEPTTALDVTVRAQILRLLDRLRRELSMAILLVSHDLGLVQSVADRVSVMYAGRAVDVARSDELFAWPVHPYTELLLEAIPMPDRRGARLRAIPGRVPDGASLPGGCAFHPRCPIAQDRCVTDEPSVREYRPDHGSACHRGAERVAGTIGDGGGVA